MNTRKNQHSELEVVFALVLTAAVFLFATSCTNISSSSASTTSSTKSVTTSPTDYAVGDTKSIYIDMDENISTFSKSQATLRAKGTYCYVWIIDTYYATTASGAHVNTAVAEKIAAQFDVIYPMVRNVFGNESDTLLTGSLSTKSSTSSTASSISTASGTQTATYTSTESPNIIEIANSTKTLTVSGLTSGQTVYLAKTNVTGSTVESSNVRKVKTSDCSGITLNTATSSSTNSSSSSSGSSSPTRDTVSAQRWHCALSEADLPEITFTEEATASRAATSSMSSTCDTGTMVNIVLYDIAADYSESATSTTGVAGYFYSRDYYTNASASNKGKYFYVDSAYANEDINDIYSTLAHEFQHMIHFGVKNISQGVSSGTAFNEMLSMLCEDMMECYFEDNLDGFSLSSGPAQRLPFFNAWYYVSGLEYLTSSTASALCSYASNYAFGAWLIRNYGGIPLLAEMSANSSVDTNSITQAVQTVNGTAYSMEDLLKDFAASCIISREDYGFNKAISDAGSYSYSDDSVSYDYPLKALDLWNLDSQLAEYYEQTSASSSASYFKYDGPTLFASNQLADLRPYSVHLHKVGTVTDDEMTLTFSSSSPEAMRMYLIIE
ncbi:MAG: hypothetical protein K6G80_03240 [Treponema sp.]|nr:hypothetical protein [Treponema sp.]